MKIDIEETNPILQVFNFKSMIIKQQSSNLDQERFLVKSESSFSRLMDFIEGVFRHLKHPHVRTKLLDQRLNDLLRRGARCDPDALGGHLLAVGAVLRLVVEPHHAVEFQMLKCTFARR